MFFLLINNKKFDKFSFHDLFKKKNVSSDLIEKFVHVHILPFSHISIKMNSFKSYFSFIYDSSINN